MAFVMDGSVSVNTSRFIDVKDFIEGMIGEVDEENTTVAVVQFGTTAQLEFDLPPSDPSLVIVSVAFLSYTVSVGEFKIS